MLFAPLDFRQARTFFGSEVDSLAHSRPCIGRAQCLGRSLFKDYASIRPETALGIPT
jgi:hypothetical protein